MPGHEKSFSTMTVWPISEPNCSPAVVRTRIRAFRNTCFPLIARRDSPLAAAVRT